MYQLYTDGSKNSFEANQLKRMTPTINLLNRINKVITSLVNIVNNVEIRNG